jgi:hypothetical protein
VLLAGCGAAAASPLFPIGEAAFAEPEPGFDLDLLVLGTVAVGTVLLVAAAATTAALVTLTMPTRSARPRRSAVARAAYRLNLPVPVVVGARFALEPGRAGAAVRPALLGAVAGALGVLGALTFQVGIDDASANPARFGQTFQVVGRAGFNGEDGGPVDEVLRMAAADPDVVAVNNTRVGVTTIAGSSVTVFSLDPVGRPLSIPMVSGRLPSAPDEIVLAPGSARYAGAEAGDVITVAGRGDGGSRFRVTGTAFVPQDPHTGYNDGGWVTRAGYDALFPDGFFKYHEARIALRPGADAAAVLDRLNTAVGDRVFYDSYKEFPLPPVDRFHSVRVLPLALGVFLGLLAVGAVGHALFVGVRRRRHEVAVLRALGITRWQARSIVATQAVTICMIGLAVGIPAGIVLGRVVWRAVATSTPLLYVAPTAVVALALAVPVALAVSSALAAQPARRAGRLRVPDVLRAE